MRGDEIIDVDVDPQEARRARWRRIARFGTPLLAVVSIVAAIIAIDFYAYRGNRNDALALSQNLIAVLDERVKAEVESYLKPAAQAVRTLADMIPEQGLSSAGRPFVEKLTMQLLRDREQVDALYVGDPQGNFLMAQRSQAGAMDTKVVEQNGAERQVTWYRRNETEEIETVEEDPDDSYDPRNRPWYRDATSVDGLVWTDVYVFFTAREPGLTAARAAYGPGDELLAVAGGDITLAALSDFLAGLELGASGRAMIIDAGGRLVAYPDPAAVVAATDEEVHPAHIDVLGDPVLTEAYDRVRVTGNGRSIVEIDDRRYIVAASRLTEPGAQDWRLLLVVPEDELVGFLAANSRRSLWMSSAIVAMAIGLAVLLARQGMLADRSARALSRRETALAAQTAALEDLSSTASQFDPGDQAALRRLTETVGHALAARRSSLWQIDDRRGEIVCLDCYDREGRGHTAGTAIRRVECPELLDALQRGDEIAVSDAAEDPRTAGVARIYLSAVGSRSLLSVPITNGARVVGCIWIEDAGAIGQGVEPRPFARTIARLIAARFAASGAPAGEAASEPESVRPAVAVAAAGGRVASVASPTKLDVAALALRTASISDERSRAVLRQMSGRSDGQLIATLYPHTAVLVLRFLDDLALAARADAEQEIGVIERIVATFQEVADRLQVRYVKIMTNEIVAAEGFDGDPRQAAETLGEAALALQNACARSFARLGGGLDYAIGLDSGTAIGSSVGFGETAYNIWGEALRVASSLAATTPRGTIQASQAFYEQTRDGFVYRRRGGFYLEQVGEMTTYALRGRL
ncbi:MAG TPA: cache domain-containing protein [Geminicoccaceae bacterium]|nr:cache domain-containing protein [Geminicoccaceae bacterium]